MPDDFASLMRSGVAMSQRQKKILPTTSRAPILPPDSNANTIAYGDQTVFAQNGVGEKKARQLRKKKPQDSIDLHGLTIVEAHAELDAFLAHAYSQGLQVVEIIHGKGEHSVGGRGVLRNKTRQWLSHCRLILAYNERSNNAGALLALLRTQ